MLRLFSNCSKNFLYKKNLNLLKRQGKSFFFKTKKQKYPVEEILEDLEVNLNKSLGLV
jgi:hypothetical protein